MNAQKFPLRSILALLIACLSLFALSSCATYETREMLVTAYSSDQYSTNWKRHPIFFWKTVIASGPRKGKPKKVGITSSGVKARMGTIAADTKYYPYGTIMIIPGYGKGVVEDIGGAIKGPNRLDVYYSTRKKALKWGKQTVKVKIKR